MSLSSNKIQNNTMELTKTQWWMALSWLTDVWCDRRFRSIWLTYLLGRSIAAHNREELRSNDKKIFTGPA